MVLENDLWPIDRGERPDKLQATVSVVVPCFNYGRYLPQAVASVLSQSGVSPDVIIVDDASTDDSLVVARALANRDPRVRVLVHERNTGPVQTFNDGLALARGEFLVRLDADDLLTPGSLSRAVAVMRQHPNVGLVYGHPLHFAGSELPPARTVPRGVKVWPGRNWLIARCRTGLNVITSPEVVMRRSVVDFVGGQRPLDHTHDMEMWMRMSAFSDVAYIRGVDQAWHREHADSLSARYVDTFRDLTERRDAFDVLLGNPAPYIEGSVRLHRLAKTAIATEAVELASRQFDRRNADLELVSRLLEVAAALVPDVRRLRGWKGLEKRMALGAARASRHPLFMAHRIVRGLVGRYRRRRWHWAGV